MKRWSRQRKMNPVITLTIKLVRTRYTDYQKKCNNLVQAKDIYWQALVLAIIMRMVDMPTFMELFRNGATARKR
jgi:hypothetical protein